MKKKILFFSILALTLISFPARKTGAQSNAPVRYLRERGVTRVQALDVGAPALNYLAAGDFLAQKKAAPNATQWMKLDLFPDISLAVTVNEVQQTGKTVTWFGSVDGSPYGNATFVLTEAGLVGAITRGDGKMYQIRTAEDGSRWSLEIDQSKFPDEIDPLPMPLMPAADPVPVGHDALAPADDGSTIDVMVLYTPAARQAAGGTASIQQLVQLGIAETNQGYINSGVIQRVRLAETREVNYTESASISTDLQRLREQGDGFFDDVETLRTTYGADLVSLWVSTSQPTCGVGYQLQDLSFPTSALATIGFDVAELDCATGYYTFGHEMGHNMGAHHGRDDVDSNGAPPVGAYPYAFGYKHTTGIKFRTIMAYDTNCSCPRIDYWSNPSVQYSGLPTGIDPNSAQGAANYLVLNNTRSIVANYRASVSPGSITDSTPAQVTITSHTNGQTVSTSSITISGTATDAGKGDSGISSVTVNGVRASNDTATGAGTANWSRTVTLNIGANTITVIATDASSALNSSAATITVTLSGSTTDPTSPTAGTYHIFPQFADGRFSDGTYYRTTLMISNPSASTGADCSLQLRGLTVAGFNLSYSLSGSGWVISTTSGTQAIQSGYATLQCTASVEAQLLYSYYASNGVKISEATVFSSPAASFVKILADEREGASLGLAIANDTDQTTTYTVSVGGAPAPASITLAPRTAIAKFLSQFVSGIPSSNVAQVLVTSSTGTASIIGLRFTGGVFTTIPESIRSFVGPTASTYHIFPQFADGRFSDGTYYRTTRMYVNPSTTTTADCTTNLRGLTSDGFNAYSASVQPTGAVISPSSGTQAFQSGYATLQCSSSVDAQALYSFYAANGVKLSEATVFSSPAAQQVQVLADTRGGSRMGIAIANDSDQTNTYAITVSDVNGSLVGTATQTLAPRAAIARFVDELVSLPANYYGQVIVSSTTGTASIIGLRFTGSVFTTIPETIR